MHEAHDRPEPDHGFGHLRQRFVIDQQATAKPPGSKGLFYAPALGEQHKALRKVWASDDLDRDAQARQHGLKAPRIRAVGSYAYDPREERTHLTDQIDATVAVLHGPVGDKHGQEVAAAIHQDMALAAVDL